ncbi:MAG: amidohydrolase [Candidatus Hodarchaeota archaeon]
MSNQILFYNGKIWTSQGLKSWMLIDSNEIKEIGDDPKPNINAKSINLQQRLVLPGLIDAHIHVYHTGWLEYNLQLDRPRSIAELQNKLNEYIKGYADKERWIAGFGWDQDYMEDKRYPTRYDLDRIVEDRPVALTRVCGHLCLVNSKALQILGITADTPDPEGGSIDRDENGEPTGILRETAQEVIDTYIEIKNKDTRKKIIGLGLEKCLSVGLTTVQTNDYKAWEIYSELQEEGKLPIRVYLTPMHAEIMEGKYLSPNTRKGFLYTDRVKILVDGGLGGHTGALREPYADTGTTGQLIYSQEELNNKVKFAKEKGFRLEVHGVGDLAAEQILNAYETTGLTKEDRPILTHCQLLGKDLIERMKDLGVIANIQPSFVSSESPWIEKRLGESRRLKYAYAWKTLIENEIYVAGSSDSPVEKPDPLLGLYSAIFRYDPKGKSWRPEECLTFEEALKIYTEGGAYAIKEEHSLGRLETGYKADFVVVDKDVSNNPELLRETRIEQVWVDGKRRL